MSGIQIEFDDYVRHRLLAWGKEFRLDREFYGLGHKSKDMLQVLIEHKGEMPPRVTGYKPLTIPPLEMEVEDIVHDMHAAKPVFAVVVRAFYCGSGRQGHERREAAEKILRTRISRGQYYEAHDAGFRWIEGNLRIRCGVIA